MIVQQMGQKSRIKERVECKYSQKTFVTLNNYEKWIKSVRACLDKELLTNLVLTFVLSDLNRMKHVIKNATGEGKGRN